MDKKGTINHAHSSAFLCLKEPPANPKGGVPHPLKRSFSKVPKGREKKLEEEKSPAKCKTIHGPTSVRPEATRPRCVFSGIWYGNKGAANPSIWRGKSGGKGRSEKGGKGMENRDIQGFDIRIISNMTLV